MAGKKKQLRKPGSQARAESATLGQVIEGESQEVQTMDQKVEKNKDVSEGTQATESAQVEEVTEVTAEQVSGDAEGQTPSITGTTGDPELDKQILADPGTSTEFENIKLANGTEITADTVMQCGSCGARFYAKDVTAPDGGCPATGPDPADASATITCGGTLGPVQV